MKFHLLSYNRCKLNTKDEDVKFCNYLKGLYFKVDIICLKKKKLRNDKATNISRQLWHDDALPSSLMDSTVSPKVKTTKGEGIGVRSLAHNTLRVKGRVRALGWGLGRLTSKSITHMDLHKPNNKLVSA
jgi:hypothetical protein